MIGQYDERYFIKICCTRNVLYKKKMFSKVAVHKMLDYDSGIKKGCAGFF